MVRAEALAELLEEMRGLDVADADLATALSQFFPFSRTEGGRSVDYFRDGEHGLTCVYRSDGALASLAPGPWLSEAGFEELRRFLREALVTGVSRVARSILYGLVPCEGSWRHADTMQLLPVPPEAPQPPQILTNQPLILEVRYTGVQNPTDHMTLEAARATEATAEAGLLLAGLIPRLEYRRATRSRAEWGIELEGGEARSKWFQVGYTFPGFGGSAESFTEPSGLACIPLTPSREFYQRFGISTDDQAIDLPDQLPQLLDTFYLLSAEECQRFLRWCFWMNHAKQVGFLARSAAHLSVVQAVEALMPNPSDTDTCAECGQRLGPGPTARFDVFLRKFAPTESRDKDSGHKDLYRLRSALGHGGKLLQDELFGRGMDLRPSQLSEDTLLSRTRQVAQVAGVNWLLSRVPAARD